MNYSRILRTRLIGKEASIVYGSKEFQGIIVKETQKTLIVQLQESNRIVTIPKVAGAMIKLTVAPGRSAKIRGDILVGRSIDRLKRRWKSW